MMFAWGVCTRSLTGIVCERVKQWKTSQLTDTLSCSHFEWQQAGEEPWWLWSGTEYKQQTKGSITISRSFLDDSVVVSCWSCASWLYHVTVFLSWSHNSSVERIAAHVWMCCILSAIAELASKTQRSLLLPRVPLWPGVKQEQMPT